MVTQALPIPTAPCALPEIPESAVFAATYVVLPEQPITAVELRTQALALLLDAGLPALPLGTQQTVTRHGEQAHYIFVYEEVFHSLFLTIEAPSPELALARFSARMAEWGRKHGLLPALQTMEGGPARA